MYKITFEEAFKVIEKYKRECQKEAQKAKEKGKKTKKKKGRDNKNEYIRQYKANRDIVLILDNNSCRECGSKESLHVHHIKPRSKGGTNDINNLITLCGMCHAEKHKGENVYRIMVS